MLSTTIYYILAFLLFIACIGGVQKWAKLPQIKKDKVCLIVLSIFLIAFLSFISVIIFKPTYLSVDTSIPIGMLFGFLLIVFTVFFIKWYIDRYYKKINIASVIIALSLTFFGAVFLVLKFVINTEKENIIKNVALNATVVNITFDTHKPYFKDMVLSDGQYLPMPEAMNNTLQVGDSIYKSKGEAFYTIVSAATKSVTKIELKVHERVLGKAQ